MSLLQLSTGSINKSLRESARALAPVEMQIVRELVNTSGSPDDRAAGSEAAVGQTVDSPTRTDDTPDKMNMLFVDETSHPEAGDLLWMWIFTTTTALFMVGHRSREIFDNLIDCSGFDGWLMTDGYRVYRTYLWRLRCWAHLLCEVENITSE